MGTEIKSRITQCHGRYPDHYRWAVKSKYSKPRVLASLLFYVQAQQPDSSRRGETHLEIAAAWEATMAARSHVANVGLPTFPNRVRRSRLFDLTPNHHLHRSRTIVRRLFIFIVAASSSWTWDTRGKGTRSAARRRWRDLGGVHEEARVFRFSPHMLLELGRTGRSVSNQTSDYFVSSLFFRRRALDPSLCY